MDAALAIVDEIFSSRWWCGSFFVTIALCGWLVYNYFAKFDR